MSIPSSIILSLSMSTDAFAVSISKGTRTKKPRLIDALKIATVFATVEGIAPLIGWAIGLSASSYIKDIDHWIAFTILCAIGIKFIYEALTRKDNEHNARPQSLKLLILTAMATSIDAFAIGISLAFVKQNILLAALSIAAATFMMSTIGIMTGQYLGKKAGRYAEALGGIGLICIGTKILIEHLHHL